MFTTKVWALLPNSELLVTPARGLTHNYLLFLEQWGWTQPCKLQDSCICCLLRICLASICLPTFLNSWGFIGKKSPPNPHKIKCSLCHIPAGPFICVQLHLDFLLCYLCVWILLLFPFIIMGFLINSLNKWSILALKICHWYLCRFITKPPPGNERQNNR